MWHLLLPLCSKKYLQLKVYTYLVGCHGAVESFNLLQGFDAPTKAKLQRQLSLGISDKGFCAYSPRYRSVLEHRIDELSETYQITIGDSCGFSKFEARTIRQAVPLLRVSSGALEESCSVKVLPLSSLHFTGDGDVEYIRWSCRFECRHPAIDYDEPIYPIREPFAQALLVSAINRIIKEFSTNLDCQSSSDASDGLVTAISDYTKSYPWDDAEPPWYLGTVGDQDSVRDAKQGYRQRIYRTWGASNTARKSNGNSSSCLSKHSHIPLLIFHFC